MIYSIWDHADRHYNYYSTPEKDAETSAPKPKHLRHHKLGATPDEAAWPLPASAKWAGRGKYPKGRIASATGGSSALGIIPFDLTLTNLLLFGAVGYFGWRYLSRRR